MKLLPIYAKGKGVIAYTKVDDIVFDKLNDHKWYMFNNFGRLYVYRWVSHEGKYKRVWLADEVSLIPPDKYYNDHWNGDTLDNRKENLRPSTMGENSCNRKKYSNNGSVYKGVEPVGKQWRAKITHNKVFTNIGYYSTEIEAAKAYDEAAVRLHGQFASINFPEGMKEVKI
jgi:hypothetical protein